MSTEFVNKYHGARFSVPVRPMHSTHGAIEVITLDAIPAGMHCNILSAYRTHFPQFWFENVNNTDYARACLNFSVDMRKLLPFLSFENFDERCKDLEFDSDRFYSGYFDAAKVPRLLSEAVNTKSIDCVVQALAIAHVIGHDGWELFHRYTRFTPTKHRTRHLLLAKRHDETHFLIDPIASSSAALLRSPQLMTCTPAEFREDYFEPVIEYPTTTVKQSVSTLQSS